MDASDGELIRSFARQGSHEAFATLVQRHVDLAYSAARRQLRSQHLAEQATQLVFVALAQQAAKLENAASLASWCLDVTHRLSIDLMKREGRRPVREQSPLAAGPTNASSEWARIEPVLDDAITSLDNADSTALLLRYFETKDLRAVGTALGTTDVAAQKRIGHALDALRDILRRRGIVITSGDLSANLSAYGIELAPPALAQTVTTSVLAGGSAATALPAVALGVSAGQRVAIVAAVAIGLAALAFEGVTLGRAHATVVRLRNENDNLVAQVRAIEEQRRTAAMAAAAAQTGAVAPEAASRGSGKAPASVQPAKQ